MKRVFSKGISKDRKMVRDIVEFFHLITLIQSSLLSSIYTMCYLRRAFTVSLCAANALSSKSPHVYLLLIHICSFMSALV